MSTAIEEATTTDTGLDEAFRSIVGNEFEYEHEDSGGDHERFAHYVNKEDIVRSGTTGEPVFALCGKKWTPRRNPDNFQVCPTCKEKLEELPEE